MIGGINVWRRKIHGGIKSWRHILTGHKIWRHKIIGPYPHGAKIPNTGKMHSECKEVLLCSYSRKMENLTLKN